MPLSILVTARNSRWVSRWGRMARCRFLRRSQAPRSRSFFNPFSQRLTRFSRGFASGGDERFECHGKVLANAVASALDRRNALRRARGSVIRSRVMARSLAVAPFAIVGVVGILGSLAFARHAASGEHESSSASSRPSATAVSEAFELGSVPAPPGDERAAAQQRGAFAALLPLRFTNENTRQSEAVELYDADGHVNEAAAARLDSLLCDTRDPKSLATLPLDRRTLQLTVRAALHFHATEVRVVSAYRKPGRRREGLHASGKAIDFKLPGVASNALAAYLRTLPRVGVGIYTHPKTAYVHLDDREHSFHWLDASPPGRTWRERSIGDASLARRDAAYRRADDWPEGTTPPQDIAP
jgi:uncharacterized protein YcbK (DUF882 family)